MKAHDLRVPCPGHPPPPLKGRGAVANVAHRFQAHARDAFDDGWSHAHTAPPEQPQKPGTGDITEFAVPVSALRTTTTVERARRILNYNQSSDISFDRSINPYRGCEHGCTYCYARATHAYLGYSPGLDFETRLVAKGNAVEALRAELARPGYRPATIALGTVTDVYQPIEKPWRLTRGILELLDACSHPVAVITKNALIERDIDVLASMAKRRLVMVYLSITTLDASMARQLEPRASAPWRRIACVQALSNAGIPVGVMVAPLIPFITDTTLEQVLVAAGKAGASHAGYTVLRLPHEVREVFQDWLAAHYPDRAERVLHRLDELNGASQGKFGARMHGVGAWGQLLAQRFALAARKAGLTPRTGFALDHSRFTPPTLDGQQSLF